MGSSYLEWVSTQTRTKWWNDSADPAELDLALRRGAIGVTTNPFLSNLALTKNRSQWSAEIQGVLAQNLAPEAKAEAMMRIAVTKAAEKFRPEYEASKGASGYVCGQVNPLRAGDRQFMYAMAKRVHTWAPNIAVKLPVTSAGLDVLEDCIAEGITVTGTVSFSVPQMIAVAERHRRGTSRAKEKGIQAGKCFSTLMIGRLDDFLREIALDSQATISESDVCQAGLAVAKRVYEIYRERHYGAALLIAALRGPYHLTDLAGADLLMSIAPSFQDVFTDKDFPREERIQKPVSPDVIERLNQVPEFVRAYEPDGMKPCEFVAFGATQRTLSQFCEVGWKLMESFR